MRRTLPILLSWTGLTEPHRSGAIGEVLWPSISIRWSYSIMDGTRANVLDRFALVKLGSFPRDHKASTLLRLDIFVPIGMPMESTGMLLTPDGPDVAAKTR